MPSARLQDYLRRIRHRLILIGGTSGVCWGLALIGLVLLASVWLDLLWELSPQWRLGASASALVAGLLLFTLVLARAITSARYSHAARRLDHAANGGGFIVSGWELSQQLGTEKATTGSRLTAGLASVAVDQATQLAETVPASQAVSFQPLRKAAGTCGVLALSTALAALFLPTLTGTELNRFLNPYSDVPPFSQVRFAVQPGDSQVIYGSDLEIEAIVVVGSAEQLQLILDDGTDEEVLPMFSEPGQRWRTTLTQVTEPAQYYVRADRARSRRFRLEVVTVPLIESVQFRVTPPSYTNEPSYEGPLPKNGLSGLPGTNVIVSAKSNRPLSGGSFTVEGTNGTQEIALQPLSAESHEVSGGFIIDSAGKFELAVTDVTGQSSQDPFNGNITLLTDQTPYARLLAPQPYSLATPSAEVPISAAAEDDYGIAHVQLFRSLNNSRPLPRAWQVDTPAPRRWHDQTRLPLADYGLSPGDEIKLFVRAEDNDPAGPKGAETVVATIRIISQAEFERLLRQQQGLQALMSKYQAAERRLESMLEKIAELQKQIADADRDATVADARRDELKQLLDALREHAAEIAESAAEPLPYDADRELNQHLQRLADELSRAAKSLAASSNDAQLTNTQLSEQLQELMQQLSANRQGLKKEAMEPLELLARVYPLLQDQARFVALAQRQRDLADRLTTIKGQDGDVPTATAARMHEMEAEQMRLGDELDRLLRDIEEHVRLLPDQEEFDKLRDTATEFVAAVRESDAADAMDAAKTALNEQQGTEAQAQATRAADILERFIKKCQGIGEGCENCLLAFQPSLGDCLGSTAQQLLAQAGFGSGSGAGGMAGSGYSAQLGGASQMGLYGNLPGIIGPAGRGSGPDDYQQGGGAGAHTAAGEDRPFLFPSDRADTASAASEGMIPPAYRQRVGQYFLRITEETGKQ